MYCAIALEEVKLFKQKTNDENIRITRLFDFRIIDEIPTCGMGDSLSGTAKTQGVLV